MAYTASGVLSFGELPDTAKLRAAGHAKIDHSIRWVQRKEDGLYLQSRYGVTRLSPVGSGILRVTFSRGEMPPVHPATPSPGGEKLADARKTDACGDANAGNVCGCGQKDRCAAVSG